MNLPELVIPKNLLAKRPKFLAYICKKIFKFIGWKVVGQLPENKNLMVAVGPHTSNWDFVVGMLFVIGWDARINWIGKHTIFKPGLNKIFRKVGGIPVNRSAPESLLQDIKKVTDEYQNYILAIAPEGTRKKVQKLKTGFIRISNQLQCDIMLAGLDFKRKMIVINESFIPSGNFDLDVIQVREYFANFGAKKVNNF
jgi:1-acyl-sn-glycerol-3-phosphate acyltransferase